MNGIGQSPPSTYSIGIHVTDAIWIGRAVDTPRLDLCANLHYDGTNWRLKRTASGAAALILEGNALTGAIDFYRVAGGTAGATASLSSQLAIGRSEEHTTELQSLMRISSAVFCLNNTMNNTIVTTICSLLIYILPIPPHIHHP